MSYKEKDIVYENGNIFVLKDRYAYVVCISGITHAETDSAYDRNEDGLSMAKARADYLNEQTISRDNRI